MAENLRARLFALRALAVIVSTAMLLACLASGAWARQDASLETPRPEPRREAVGPRLTFPPQAAVFPGGSDSRGAGGSDSRGTTSPGVSSARATSSS